MKFIAILALSIAGISSAAAAESQPSVLFPTKQIGPVGDNLFACVGYYHAVVDLVEPGYGPFAIRALNSATAQLSAYLSRLGQGGGFSDPLSASRDAFVTFREHDREGFLQTTLAIAEDCERTFAELTFPEVKYPGKPNVQWHPAYHSETAAPLEPGPPSLDSVGHNLAAQFLARAFADKD